MVAISVSLFLASAGFGLAHPSQPLAGRCSDVSFRITADAYNLVYGDAPDSSNATAISSFFLSSLTTGPNVVGIQHINDTYPIEATYCQPPKHVKSRDTLQLLVHGLAYDKNYWSSDGFSSKYDYAASATSQGYHTLAITRLGHGAGKKLPRPDPISVIQSSMHIDVIHQLLQQAKAGTLLPKVPKFKSLVYVGHSYGSSLGTNHAQAYPGDVDAYVLTGWTSTTNLEAPFIPDLRSAATVAEHLRKLPLGYLASQSEKVSTGMFFAGEYNSKLAHEQFERRDTAAVGEFLSQGIMGAPSNFKGKVYLITGDLDAFFCAGGREACKKAMIGTGALYPNATFEYAIVKKTGHALNFHYNAAEVFKMVNDWLAKAVKA